MNGDDSTRARWGRFRFSVIGGLLASPPEHGDLQGAIAALAARTWRHPTHGQVMRVSAKTIERWYYVARSNSSDPVGALSRRTHSQAGKHPSVSLALAQLVVARHREHPGWSYQLHYDNLKVLVEQDASLGAMPSYPSLCRFMKARGLRRRKKRRHPDVGVEPREVRSYEASHVFGLWHFDFHEGSRRVLLPTGDWVKPQLFGCLDDRSRLACHLQWYLTESAETAVHGLSQAIRKRGLPRKLLTDNGGAETAAEMEEGLERIGITHQTTLPRHPEQNGKQESFWGQIEGRLLPMLEGHQELTLKVLNDATQAWVELEYNRKRHRELGVPPLDVFTTAPSVRRPAPEMGRLKRAFRAQVSRKQRRSDGTVTVDGVRYEVPSAYRALTRVHLRHARWDRAIVELVDGRTGRHLADLYPLDKRGNADGRRRTVGPVAPDSPIEPRGGMAPLLSKLMADYAATGMPPAYVVGPQYLDHEEDE